jgi:malonate transporter and related proteins
MLASFIVLLPVFIVIAIGWVLRKTSLVVEAQWQALDHVCYFVLFPAIIFKEIATADFSHVPVWSMALAMILAISTMFALLLIFRRSLMAWLKLDGPQFASLFQGATRWHTFISLAIIPVYFGNGALALGGLSAAAMIPLLNIVNVGVHALYVRTAPISIPDLSRAVVTNPFVVASLGAIAWRVLQLPTPAIAVTVLDTVGKGALGLALLTVGAGLRLDQARQNWPPLALATGLKLLVMPLFMFGWTAALGVSGEAQAVAILCGAVPTGSGAYTLARKMGGDATLVANILTLQVILAAITIPLVLSILT